MNPPSTREHGTGAEAAELGYNPTDLTTMLNAGTWYVPVHRRCGHVGTAHHNRHTLATTLTAVPAPLRHQLRIRVATRDDLIASLRGHRCPTCTRPGPR